MLIKKITDPAFRAYGRILTEYDCAQLLEEMEKTPVPEGVSYVPSLPELEKLPLFDELRRRSFGGMEIQMGYCNGHNRKLDAVEYHKSSEWNLA